MTCGVFNADDVNLLVYRYLLESGYTHSAFLFNTEAGLAANVAQNQDVPPGALVAFLSKGLEYVSIEEHVNEEGRVVPCSEPFSLVRPHKCPTLAAGTAAATNTTARGQGGDRNRKGPEPQKEKAPPTFAESEIHVMKEHSKEVFVISWNPTYDLLVTGSSDCTAKIWKLPGGENGAIMHDESGKPIYEDTVTLRHTQKPSDKNKDVTCLEWSRDGEFAATGSLDGYARIWNNEGEIVHTLAGHTQAVFALRWNPSGKYVASGSQDWKTIVWDTHTGREHCRWPDSHQGPVLDVAWRDEETFVTCSTDKTIQYNKVGESKPIKVFRGHDDEVNTVLWDPSGTLLASCSDDHTAKIWKPELSEDPVADLKEHVKEIYSIRWSPTGPGTDSAERKRLLASCSFDNTVKIWDVESGKSLSTFTKHVKSVYAIAFDKSGDYLASGALGGALYIWSVKDCAIVRSFQLSGDIFEVSWDRHGKRVAVAYSTGKVAVLDFRK